MRFLLALSIALAIVMAAAPRASAAWLWPVDGEVLTPYRNGDDPYAAGMHRGIDIAAPLGSPVVAAEAGRVTFAGVAGSSGLTVAVDTGALTTSYLHLASTAVRRGDAVRAGDRVGEVGESGSNRSAAQPHLHFGVRQTGSAHGYRDPLGLLGPRITPREAPAPEPVGAPAALPEPVAPEPAPVPSPRPRRRPAPEPTPVPAPAPVRVPVERPAPAPAPVRRPAPSARRAPRVPLPGRGPAAQPVRGARVPAHRMRISAPATRQRSSLPWAAACGGLLLAAGALGLGSARRSASSIGRPCPTTSRRPSTT